MAKVNRISYTAIPLIAYVEQSGRDATELLEELGDDYPTSFDPGAALLIEKKIVLEAAKDLDGTHCSECGQTHPGSIYELIRTADTQYFIIGVDNIAEPSK